MRDKQKGASTKAAKGDGVARTANTGVKNARELKQRNFE